MENLTKEKARVELQLKINTLNSRIEKFKKQFAENPCYALEWSKETFKDAAALKTFLNALIWLDRSSVEKIVEVTREELLFTASYCANQSTSATANLMELSKLEAKAELVKLLSGSL